MLHAFCTRVFTSLTDGLLHCHLPSFAADALADTDTLQPRPDYYTAVLFQRLMGTRVLPVSVSLADPDLHIYAHCLRTGGRGTTDNEESSASRSTLHDEQGDVAFAFLNRSPDKSFDVTLLAATDDSSSRFHITRDASEGPGADDVVRSEFHLQSANKSDVFASQVLLNGALLRMTSWEKLPQLTPKVVEGSSPLHVASQTVGFAILHGAKTKACM